MCLQVLYMHVKKVGGAKCAVPVSFLEKMAGEARLSSLQSELAKVNAAFVAAVCEHRECKTALQARVKALEADLAISKDTCKNQEYHIQKAAESAGRGKGVGTSEEKDALIEMQKKIHELETANVGLEKRNHELEASESETVGMRKRMRELEVVEAGWMHLRGVFMTRG